MWTVLVHTPEMLFKTSARDTEQGKWLPLTGVVWVFFTQQKGILITLRSSLIADLVTVVGSQHLIGCFLLIV